MSWQASIQQMFNNPDNSLNSINPGGSSASMFTMNPWMMGGAGLASLLGGIFNKSGADNLGSNIRQGMGDITNYANQGLAFLDPYNQAGQAALGQYSQALNGMSNPVDYVNNIMGQYKQSPQSQFNTQEMLRAANNASAASGQLGSPAEQMAISRYQNQIDSTDQQQFLNNALGVNSQYMGGLQGLAGMGYGAAGQMNQNRLGLGDEMAQMYQNLGMANMYGNQSMGSGIGGFLGGLASLL
jgi:hypothetical protein